MVVCNVWWNLWVLWIMLLIIFMLMVWCILIVLLRWIKRRRMNLSFASIVRVCFIMFLCVLVMDLDLVLVLRLVYLFCEFMFVGLWVLKDCWWRVVCCEVRGKFVIRIRAWSLCISDYCFLSVKGCLNLVYCNKLCWVWCFWWIVLLCFEWWWRNELRIRRVDVVIFLNTTV